MLGRIHTEPLHEERILAVFHPLVVLFLYQQHRCKALVVRLPLLAMLGRIHKEPLHEERILVVFHPAVVLFHGTMLAVVSVTMERRIHRAPILEEQTHLVVVWPVLPVPMRHWIDPTMWSMNLDQTPDKNCHRWCQIDHKFGDDLRYHYCLRNMAPWHLPSDGGRERSLECTRQVLHK